MIKKSRITNVTVEASQYDKDSNNIRITVSRVWEDDRRSNKCYRRYDYWCDRASRQQFFDRGVRMQQAFFDRGIDGRAYQRRDLMGRR